jgi:signal transduction histidine kinase
MAVLNAETGQRGFLLTGSKEYLTPYDDAKREIPALLKTVRGDSLQIAKKPQLGANLERDVKAKLDELTLSIALYSKNPAAALAMVETNRGHQLMTRIRAVCRKLQDKYFQLSLQQFRLSERMSFLGLCLQLILGGFVFVLLFMGAKRLTASLAAKEALRQDYQALVRKLHVIREEERGRLARDIHDDLGQVLTGVKMDLALVIRRMGKNEHHAALKKLDESSSSVDDAIQSLRRLAMTLRPAILDQLGLIAALEWQAREFEARTRIPVHVSKPDQEPPLSNDERTALFRITQEALTNVARHAQAKSVQITLITNTDSIELVIEDDGVGMPSDRRKGSLGLLGMQERAKLINAELSVRPGEHGGTAVSVCCRLGMSERVCPSSEISGRSV